MKRVLLLFFSFWSLLSPDVTWTQSYSTDVNYFGVEQGLSHRQVNTIFQDRDGFMWMGCNFGLNRFDGYQFEEWKNKEKDQLNLISGITQDAAGYLWIIQGNFGDGPDTIKLINYPDPTMLAISDLTGKPNPFFMKDIGRNFLTDGEGRIYFGNDTKGELYIYDSRTGFKTLEIPSYQRFSPALITTRQTIWGVGNNRQFIEIDLQGKVLQSFQHDHPVVAKSAFLLEEEIFYITQEAYSAQLNLFAIRKDGTRRAFSYADIGLSKKTRTLLNTKNTSNGLVFFQFQDMLYGYNFNLKEPLELTGLIPDLKTSVNRGWYEEPNKRLWIGSDFGVYTFQIEQQKFTYYLVEPEEGGKKFKYSARGMHLQGEQLYVSTNTNAVFRIDLETGEETILKGTEPGTNTEIRTIAPGDSTGFWLGGLDLFWWDIDQQSLQKIPFSRKRNSNVKIWDIQDQGKELLLATDSGLATFQKGADQLQWITDYGKFPEVDNAFVVEIVPTQKNQLWLCTNKGLYLMDGNNQILHRYWQGGTGEYYLPSEDIFNIYIDKENVHWIATGGSGLIRWDFNNKTIKQFTKKDGLPNQVIYASIEDEEENLWLSSDYGIVQFDKKTDQMYTFLPKKGGGREEYNRKSAYQAPDGRIFFGGLNGVTAFHPSQIRSSSELVKSKLVLDAIEVYSGNLGKSTNKLNSFREDKLLELASNDPFFNIRVVLLAYLGLDKITYAFRFDEEKEWQLQRDPSIRVNRLSYGNHTMYIKAQEANGQWSEQLTLPVYVHRPFYLQWWFLLLVGVLLLGGLYTYNGWRKHELWRTKIELESKVARATEQIWRDKNIIEHQAKELRKEDHMKSEFFANVSHEFRTPLTLILGSLDYVLKKSNLDPRNSQMLSTAKKSGEQLHKLINEILDLSKLENRKLKLHESIIYFNPFLHQIVDVFQSKVEEKNIQFNFLYEADKQLRLMMDRDKLNRIISNLLSNAFKFTPANGTITLLVKEEESSIKFEISDNGRGIHPEDLPHVFTRYYQSKVPDLPTEGGTGIGLALVYEFSRFMGGNIRVESVWKQGTIFFLELPKILAPIIAATEIETAFIAQQELATDFNLSDINRASLVDNPSRIQAAEKSNCILVVEDNQELRNYIKIILSDQYEIITARNGMEALDILHDTDMKNVAEAEAEALDLYSNMDKINAPAKNQSIDLILSDVMMPIMDGYQLLTTIKSDDRLRHIPVVMLTALVDIRSKLKALRIGVDDYMVKPFVEDELKARIENLLTNLKARLAYNLKEEENEKEEVVVESPINEPHAPVGLETVYISSENMQWLEKLEVTILNEIDNFNLTSDILAGLMNISRVQLFRRIKKLTGMTLATYIQEIRLSQARTMLEERTHTSVKSVAYSVGLKHVKNFSKLFRNRFGKLPSQYLEN